MNSQGQGLKRNIESDDDSDSEYSEPEPFQKKPFYFEESSESESEHDCDSWDNDCKVIPRTAVSKRISGYHLMPTCDRDPTLSCNKKEKIVPEINRVLLNDELIDKFKQQWTKNEAFSNDALELVCDPFKVCVVHNILQNSSILTEIIQEFYELDWNMRSMDLYEFFQSKDLKYLRQEQISNIYSFLTNEVAKWVSDLTGLQFTHISATCSLYSNTDYLLVHDDQREDRLVAFVLYLTGKEGWCDTKGGALQLLSKDDLGQPKEVIRNVYPANNQLVFFPVTSDSYHQVAEVTSMNDCRLSINGWFHTKVPPTFKTPLYKQPETGLYSKNVLKPKKIDIDLDTWISEEYLENSSMKYIQKHIEENSEICLKRFFKMKPFHEILESLNNKDIQWERVGPPNRYCYDVLRLDTLPYVLERFLGLFQSEEMFHLLQRYTDLELTSPNASMKFELQRWTPGCYSLLTDYNWEEKNELDLIMYFGCTNKFDIIGATTQYVTIEDEIQNALITIDPDENNLNIVYRDSARFTKYFSVQSKCKCFYMLICSYSE